MAKRQQRDMPVIFKSFENTPNPEVHAVAMRTRAPFVKGALAVAALAVVLSFSDIVLSYCFIALAVVSWGLWGFWGKLALQQSMPATSIFFAEALTGFVVGMTLLAGLQLKGTQRCHGRDPGISSVFSQAPALLWESRLITLR
jgi:hypothetical protein